MVKYVELHRKNQSGIDIFNWQFEQKKNIIVYLCS